MLSAGITPRIPFAPTSVSLAIIALLIIGKQPLQDLLMGRPALHYPLSKFPETRRNLNGCAKWKKKLSNALLARPINLINWTIITYQQAI